MSLLFKRYKTILLADRGPSDGNFENILIKSFRIVLFIFIYCYWNNNEYYGFGLGASSYIGNIRKTNTKSITKYLKEINNEEKETLSIDDKIEYEVILNLRKKEGINLDKFKKRYKKELHEIYNYKEMLKKNLLILNNNHLSIPEDKWYISNEIIVELLGSEVK